MKPDQARVGALLIDTVSLLCRNGLSFVTDIKVQGLLGITVDNKDVFLVHFNEILSEEQSGENQLGEVETTVKSPSLTMCHNSEADESLAVEKSGIRRTAIGSSTAPRRCSNMPYVFPGRHRVRQFGQHLKYQQKVKKVDFDFVNTNEDEKLDCSNYSDVKTEAEDNVLPNVSEEQDDVILIESEDGLIGQALDVSSFVKEDKYSEVSHQDKSMFSYAKSHEHTDLVVSETMHDQESGNLQGAVSNVSYTNDCDVDVKTGNEIQSSGEIWMVPDADWSSAEHSHSTGSDYGHQSMYLQSRIPSGSCGSTLTQRKRTPQLTSTVRSMATGYHNLQREMTGALPEESFHSTNQTLMSPGLSSHEHLQHPQNQIRDWAATAGTVTGVVCKLCGKTMGHRRSLLRHQITAHGRMKQRRGRPPVFSSFKTWSHL